MTNDFNEVSMYQCVYCGKIFRTDKKHQCKFKPEFRNCFSCQHCTGIVEVTQDVVVRDEYYPFAGEQNGPELHKITTKYTTCAKGNGHSIAELSNKRWNLNCDMWDIMPNYTGKETYVRKLVWKLT